MDAARHRRESFAAIVNAAGVWIGGVGNPIYRLIADDGVGPVELFVAMADFTLGDLASAREHLDRAEGLLATLGWPVWSATVGRLRADLA